MEYQSGTSDQLWSTTNATNATYPTPGGKYMQMWWIFSTTPRHARIIGNRASHQDCQVTDPFTKNSRTTNPFHDRIEPITRY